jgi:hypothetical protein
MARCPSCDYPLPEDRQRLGARCPSCRDPLYEPPGRFGRPVRAGEAACILHSGNESIGTCARCGNFYCEICRCKWRSQLLCVACVERALDSSEGSPEQNRTHFRQALLSVLFGLGAWVPAGLLFLMVGLFVKSASASDAGIRGLFVIVGLVVMGLVLIALLGVGQGAAAIRTRGNHMIMANFGMILSALYVGAVVGMLALSVWNNLQ